MKFLRFSLLVWLFVWVVSVASAATYYIDFAGGNDSFNGTSKATAWKRHPYMAGFTGSFTHAAGDQYIFKGGVTWDQTCFTMTLLGSGSSGAGSDYYGVDKTWFTGGAWSRPVWDRAYVASGTDLLNLGNTNYITIDNIELKRLNASIPDGEGLINTGGGGGYFTTIKNCYLHGWRTNQSTDGAHGAIIGRTFSCSTTLVIDNCEIENSENSAQKNGVAIRCVAVIQNGTKIHDCASAVLFCLDFNGSELYNITGDTFDATYHQNGIYLDPASMGQTVGYVRNSYIHDCTNGANMAYLNVRNGAQVYAYNNRFDGAMSTQNPIEIEPFEYGGEGPGSVYVYNNTGNVVSPASVLVHFVRRMLSIVSGNTSVRSGCHYRITVSGTTPWTTYGSANNSVGTQFVASSNFTLTGTGECITPVTAIEVKNNFAINVTGLTDFTSDISGSYAVDHNLTLTSAQAATAGYTFLNGWTPTSGSSQTVGAGITDSRTGSVADYAGALWSGVWDIGYVKYVAGGGDTTPPTPNPSTIASATATGTTTITIVATTATDVSSPPVQYAVSTNNGSTWSSWQSSATFNITGLNPATTYQCKVKARDSATTPNETTASSASPVTTDSVSTVTGPLKNRAGALLTVGG